MHKSSFLVLAFVGLLFTSLAAAQDQPNQPQPAGDDVPVADPLGAPEGAPAADPKPVSPGPDVEAPTKVLRTRDPNGAALVERHVIEKGGKYVNHGAWTARYPDGKEMGGGDFVHGKRQGKWWRWFSSGEGMFGSPLYRGYRGPFKSEVHFVEGEIDGAWLVFDGKDQKISEWHFSLGKPHGEWTWYYPNGQVRRHCTYIEGVLDGDVVEHAPDGKVLSKEQYVAGRPRRLRVGHYGPRVKRWEGWYLYPREVTKTSYEWWLGEASTEVVGYKGKRIRDGKWTWWYPDGQKSAEGLYVAGVENGPWTWWHPNGNKWHEGAYVAGKKSGEWMHYKPNGEVERKEIFPEIAVTEAEVPAGAAPADAGTNAPGTAPAAAPAGAGSTPTNPQGGQPAPADELPVANPGDDN